ncbi:MAG TPA: hypothetical protein VLH36_06695, partial [Steroidobacteraceae bacterium]|nr:hypothetical protein [Steroidobacteraceae bacterium]
CDQVANGTGVCRDGQCVIVEGIPTVTSVIGVAPPGTAFRAGFSGGVTILGTDLDRVTSIEFEDWGWDYSHPMPSSSLWVPSTPGFTGWVFPTDSDSAPIGFAASPISVTISTAELLDKGWLWFNFNNWYKVRLHYLENGADAYVLIDVAFSLWGDPVSPPEPTITGVSTVRRLLSHPDFYESPQLTVWWSGSGPQGTPMSIASVDWTVEHPVLGIVSQDATGAVLSLAPGFDPGMFMTSGAGEWEMFIDVVYPLTDPLISEG